MWLYKATVTCNTCGKVTIYEIVSINPFKEKMTFEAKNPLTGTSRLNSLNRLECGHMQDLENTPVIRMRSV